MANDPTVTEVRTLRSLNGVRPLYMLPTDPSGGRSLDSGLPGGREGRLHGRVLFKRSAGLARPWSRDLCHWFREQFSDL